MVWNRLPASNKSTGFNIRKWIPIAFSTRLNRIVQHLYPYMKRDMSDENRIPNIAFAFWAPHIDIFIRSRILYECVSIAEMLECTSLCNVHNSRSSIERRKSSKPNWAKRWIEFKGWEKETDAGRNGGRKRRCWWRWFSLNKRLRILK